MAEKMTVAILGLGSRGLQVYAPIIEQNAEKMELVAVADLMEDKVEEAKTQKIVFKVQRSYFRQTGWRM